jgi:tetratricopeptide (TPR) repeat protein
LAAREQLQLMQSGQAAKPRPAAPRSAPASEAPRAGGARDQGILKEEILVPPEPGAVRPRAAEEEPLVLAQAASPRRRFLVIGTAVLVLALAGGAVLWTNRDRFFPNSRAAAPAPAPAPDPIARATRLHEEGKTAIAVSQLRRLPPNDPQYDRAQALIAEWETLEAPAASPAGPSPELLARRDGLAAQARAAYDSREYVRAAALFEQAAAVAPLDEATAQLALETRQAAEPLAQQVELFRQGEWEYVLPALWRLREEQPQNRDVTRLIVDSYYNLGVRDLQREDPAAAVEKLKEALLLAGDDRELERLSLFAQTYAARQQDLLYRTYVKYLPFR